MSKGNLVDWDMAQWNLVNMAEVETKTVEICKPERPGHILFPEDRNMSSAIDVCRKMKANVSVVTSQQVMDELVAKLTAIFPEDKYGRYYFIIYKPSKHDRQFVFYIQLDFGVGGGMSIAKERSQM